MIQLDLQSANLTRSRPTQLRFKHLLTHRSGTPGGSEGTDGRDGETVGSDGVGTGGALARYGRDKEDTADTTVEAAPYGIADTAAADLTPYGSSAAA